jgi:hypothetical protein
VCKPVTNERGSAKGRSLAHVPGGKTNKLVDEAKRENEDGGVQPAEFARDGQQVDQNAGERSPSQQIEPIAIDRCEERMHQLEVRRRAIIWGIEGMAFFAGCPFWISRNVS